MAWEKWEALPKERKQKILEKLNGAQTPEEKVAVFASLPRADADRLIAETIRRKEQVKQQKNNLLGEATSKFFALMGQELMEAMQPEILKLTSPELENSRNLIVIVEQLLRETQESNRIQQETNRLLSQLLSRPASLGVVVPEVENRTEAPVDSNLTPKGKIKAKSLPGVATRSSVDEERRAWLTSTPWGQFPNWRRWRPEIEILFERVMEEQADKRELEGPWLTEYTHGVLNYQRVDEAIGWETAKELWKDYRKRKK